MLPIDTQICNCDRDLNSPFAFILLLKFAGTGLKLAGIRLNYLERLVQKHLGKKQAPPGFPDEARVVIQLTVS